MSAEALLQTTFPTELLFFDLMGLGIKMLTTLDND
ncbi:hypothetical protein SAMD00079811_52260 [Scytonema sp. HK-05]|nr:hypothetical protein SAMD00079811_52260 [Scytonema sp. HK-05]